MPTATNLFGGYGRGRQVFRLHSPERTVNDSYHISVLQALGLLQSLSVDTGRIHRAQIGQNDLGETNTSSTINTVKDARPR